MGHITHPVPRWLQPVYWLWAAALAVALLLGVAATGLARDENAAAERAAGAAARAAVDTYQSQMLRSLREIDQALRMLALASERMPPHAALADLRQRGLLPPEQLFPLELGPDAPPPPGRRAGPDGLALDLPADGGSTWVFSRPLRPGWRASISADSAYFLAGYDTTRLGRQGLLAIVDTAGRSIAQREGDELRAAGDPLALRPGLLRAAALYGWPLVVAAGVSADEQLASARERGQRAQQLAALGAALVFAVAAVVARLWRRLEQARREHAERVEQMALKDALTGLANRHGLEMMFAHHQRRAQRSGEQLSLLFLDLDGFKAVNDRHGHTAGDELLRQAARRLAACVRAGDVVARLGGDEFVVLLVQPGADGAAELLARRVIAEIARPYRIGEADCHVTASVGLAHHRRGPVDVGALLRRADAAMYRAKTGGKNALALAEA